LGTNAPLSRWLSQQSALPATETGRQRLVASALHRGQGMALSPKPCEQCLLDQFVRGNQIID